ncbi:MAG: DUF3047 domain-containing protein [Smithella sp.]
MLTEVILEKGKHHVGQWVEESVNVLADYRKVFSKTPLATAGLAVVSDMDNTGADSVAYLDFTKGRRTVWAELCISAMMRLLPCGSG